MKLNDFGVQEISTQEMKKQNGGDLGFTFAVFGLFVILLIGRGVVLLKEIYPNK